MAKPQVLVASRIFYRIRQPSAHLTLKHVLVFGFAAFVLNRDPTSKVHPKATSVILLRCNDNGVYMVEKRTDRKLINFDDVTFHEDEFSALENSDYKSSDDYDNEHDSHYSQETFLSDSESQLSLSLIDEKGGEDDSQNIDTTQVDSRQSHENAEKSGREGEDK